MRDGGWIKAYRSARGRELAHREAEELKPFGVKPIFLDRAALAALEPHVGEKAIGGVHYAEPLSTSDPGALIQSYAALFVKRGGRMERGDALSLEPAGAGWMVTTDAGRLAARDAVIALGPWSDELARRFGLDLPFFVKRGYHMHYEAKGNAGLSRPVLDLERGYLVTPMARGLRLTTGAEFARRDDPPSPAHLERLEPFARELFPLGARKDAAPWLGRRPCLPDMRPIIGPFPGKPGLWLNSGHHHLGLTLGPITGRLLAELHERRAAVRRSGALPGGAVRVARSGRLRSIPIVVARQMFAKNRNMGYCFTMNRNQISPPVLPLWPCRVAVTA